MASKAVIDAVAARLAANWAACPVVEMNTTGQTPANGSTFLVVQYPVANSEQISVGSPGSQVFRETGAFRFVLSANRGAGLDAGIALTDQLATLFRGKQFGGVTTWAPSSPAIDDSNDDGLYFGLTFVVPYYADILG